MLKFIVCLVCTFLWLTCHMTNSQVDAKCLVDHPAVPTCQNRSITCPACVEVAWMLRPPFTYEEADNATVGILPAVLNLLLNKCCDEEPKCWEVNHKPPEKDAEQLLASSRDSHVTYPVIVDLQDERSLRDNLISFIPPTSIAFVVRRGKPESYPKKLLMSVFEAWPVLILTILLSILAGYNQWFLDTWTNKEEFPRTFFRGSWEGFWWAFVSMTTVGYGDRAPKSILGRVFAVVWILIGICICSIFTATLTTSLTTISLDTKKSLPGSKVGVLERSIEMALAMQQQADLKLYKTVKEMRSAMDRNEVEGVLLDNYQISHFTRSLFPSKDFKIDEIVKQETLSYGAMVNDTNLARCFKEIITKDKYLLYEFTRNELKNTLKGGESEAVLNSQSIFDPTGDLFYPSLYTCIALVIVIFVIGLVAEFCYFRPGRCACKKQGKEQKEIIPLSEKQEGPSLEQIEEQMLNEVRALFNKYRNSLEQAEDKKKNGNSNSEV